MYQTARSDGPADECFAHGLAHLIAAYGHDQGVAIAGRVLLDLIQAEALEVTAAADLLAFDPVATRPTAPVEARGFTRRRASPAHPLRRAG
jgi:hypothetical protein